ncbi:hypothetical protein BS47DRAFT_1059806 [Hydnum rufescens UP504]|uniref:Uncharacterized protein n=1 Tax=Hydnum rufescens UP504 TaxID=1448309 RepID=A0A9P6AVJ2_9AGAM|nr:hypothetical protein BS47DRAFT_1059806 [Hydnum rufescens UP504]
MIAHQDSRNLPSRGTPGFRLNHQGEWPLDISVNQGLVISRAGCFSFWGLVRASELEGRDTLLRVEIFALVFGREGLRQVVRSRNSYTTAGSNWRVPNIRQQARTSLLELGSQPDVGHPDLALGYQILFYYQFFPDYQSARPYQALYIFISVDASTVTAP